MLTQGQCEVQPRRLSGPTGRTRVPDLVTLGIYSSMPIRTLSTVHSTTPQRLSFLLCYVCVLCLIDNSFTSAIFDTRIILRVSTLAL
jgi:hypothetical protein